MTTRIIASAIAAAALANASPSLAATAPKKVDQAAWTAHKKVATLPNGMRIAYVEMGDPDGPPVILLHGYTDNSRLWSLIAPHLSKYRLLMLDQRGHGGSSAPACCYAPADFAQDVILLLDALRIGRASIVGSSMGSMVAQYLAAEQPHRIEAIVLAGSTAMAPMRRDHPLWPILSSNARPARADATFLKEWSPGASPTPVDADFTRHFDAETAAVPTHVWRQVIRELTDHQVGRHAADVRAPVLILSGEKDPLFGPEHHQSLLKAYPQAEAHLLAGLGHNLVVEQTAMVGALIARFLHRMSATSADAKDGARPPTKRSPDVP